MSYSDKKRSRSARALHTSQDALETSDSASDVELQPSFKFGVDKHGTTIPVQQSSFSSSYTSSYSSTHPTESSSRQSESTLPLPTNSSDDSSFSILVYEIHKLSPEEVHDRWDKLVSTLLWKRFCSDHFQQLVECKTAFFLPDGITPRIIIQKEFPNAQDAINFARKAHLVAVEKLFMDWRQRRPFSDEPVRRLYTTVYPGKRLWERDSTSKSSQSGDQKYSSPSGAFPSSNPAASNPTTSNSYLKQNRRARILYFFENQKECEKMFGGWRPLGADPLIGFCSKLPIKVDSSGVGERKPYRIEQTPLKLGQILGRSSSDGSLLGCAEPKNWDSGRYIPKEYEPLMCGASKPTQSLSPPDSCSMFPDQSFTGIPEPKAYDAGRYIPTPFQSKLQVPIKG